MAILKCFAISSLILSIWAIIQLTIMGFLYSRQFVTLIEDVEPHEYKNLEDFIDKCEKNYKIVSQNCYNTSGCYVALLVISIFCLMYDRHKTKKFMEKRDDDEYFCRERAKKSFFPMIKGKSERFLNSRLKKSKKAFV